MDKNNFPTEGRAIDKLKSSVSHYPDNSFPTEGLVRLPRVLEFLGIQKSCWWQGVKDGRFKCQPVKLGRATCWRADEVRSLAYGKSEGGA